MERKWRSEEFFSSKRFYSSTALEPRAKSQADVSGESNYGSFLFTPFYAISWRVTKQPGRPHQCDVKRRDDGNLSH